MGVSERLSIPFANLNGNVFPLDSTDSRVGQVNLRLTDPQIRSVCRELVARGELLSGRRLRRELANRFGFVGNTERVFRIWRDETADARSRVPDSALPIEVLELQRRLREAQAAAAENLARAERAEYREQAHQDHWAMEVDRLRQEALARPAQRAEMRGLQEQVLRLTAELNVLRSALAHKEP
jgi:hypothetical protein